MANEIVRDADATFTELERRILVEARARVVGYPLCMLDSIESVPTLVKQYAKHPVTADAAAITDGTAMSNTGIDPTSTTGTTAAVGRTSDVTDQSATGSLLDVAESARNFARALVNKIEVDISALFASFSTVVGTSGADLTVGNWLSGIYNLEVANEDAMIVSELHPIQAFDLRSAIAAAGGGIYANPTVDLSGGLLQNASRQDVADFFGSPMAAPKGVCFGVPVFLSSTVPTANAGADRAGGMFSAGRALVFLWKWAPRVETLRAPKLPGTTVAVTAAYAVFEVFDAAGVALITDA